MPPANDPNTKGAGRPQAAAPEAPKGKSWFLGIGINAYRHFPGLNNAVRDVQALQEILQERYEIDHSITLFDADAGRRNILRKFDELAAQLQPEDKLLIYYSGHGHLSAGGFGFWVPAEAERGYTDDYIPNSRLRDYLQEIRSRHILLISDACFSGSLFARGATKKLPEPEDLLESKISRYALCSGRSNEEVFDGLPGEHSPFAEAILKVLKENQDSKLRISMLSEWVVDRTASQYRQLPQHGVLFDVGHEGGQYIFYLRSSEENAWQEALQENSIRAYNRYLDQFPHGRHADQALEQIQLLEDDREWENTRGIDRVHAYHTYLRSFSAPRHADAARRRISELVQDLETHPKPKPQPLSESFMDPRDGQVYRTVELNGLRWMAQNFNFDAGEGSWFLKNDPNTSKKYGRLYTWEAAHKACPLGWRLPTEEEWKSLASFFGGYYDKIVGKIIGYSSEEGFLALRENLRIDFLPGYRERDEEFYNFNEVASYWSATKFENDQCGNIDFGVNSETIYWTKSPILLGISCRFVQGFNSIPLNIEKTTSLTEDVFTDPRDGQTYRTVELNGLRWMAQNLNFDVREGCWFYNNDPKNGEKYGRLYTWEAAKKACLPGWRMPTDNEWREMAKLFGGCDDDAKDGGKAAYKALIQGGSNGFSALLGGWRNTDGNFYVLGDNGYYWSATESGADSVWYYGFLRRNGELGRDDDNKTIAHSCRCIQD